MSQYRRNWFYRTFIHPIVYHVIRPMRNIIRWLPVIWKDKDYDDYYIWHILEVKLKHQAEFFESDRSYRLNSKQVADKIRMCVRMIEDLHTEFYLSEYMDYHLCEYLHVPVEDKPEYSRLVINEIWEKFDDYFKKYPHAYREVTKTDKYIFPNDSKRTIAMNMGIYLHDKARRVLFALLEHHIEDWWD